MRTLPYRSVALFAVASLAAAACGSSSSSGGSTASSCNPGAIADASAGTANAVALPQSGLALAGSTQASSSDPVLKIGFVGMLAGQYQNYGVDEKDGVQLAIDEVNAAGGVSYQGTTYTFQLDAQDDNADATQGVQAAQKLVDDGVVAVVGGVFSTATIAESKIFNDNGIVQISPSATNPKYTSQGFKTAFRVVGRDDQQGPADGDFIVQTLKCKNVAVMDDKSTYGQGLADQVASQVAKDGGTVVDREHIDASASDFTAQLTTVKGKKPDVIFFGGYSAQAGPLTAQARRLGITAPFAMGDGCQDSDYIKLASSDANNNFASNAGPDHSLMTGYSKFASDFKTKFGLDVFQYAPQAYDAANIIMQAVKTAGGTKSAILGAVAQTKGYQGIAQSYTFTSTGDVTEGIFTVYKVESGSWKAVKAITVSAS